MHVGDATLTGQNGPAQLGLLTIIPGVSDHDLIIIAEGVKQGAHADRRDGGVAAGVKQEGWRVGCCSVSPLVTSKARLPIA